jgi:hypothetical protein
MVASNRAGGSKLGRIEIAADRWSPRGPGVNFKPVRTLGWYVLRQHLVPWLLGFGVVTGTLQIDLLVDYLDLWIQRGACPFGR